MKEYIVNGDKFSMGSNNVESKLIISLLTNPTMKFIINITTNN